MILKTFKIMDSLDLQDLARESNGATRETLPDGLFATVEC
jgi:hypothetical protein